MPVENPASWTPVRGLCAVMVCAAVASTSACSSDTSAPKQETSNPSVTGNDAGAPDAQADEADASQSTVVDSAVADLDADLDAGTDADATMELDARAFEPPPDANWDAEVPNEIIGKTYAETAYSVLAPTGLATAFNILASNPGSTRVFVNDVRADADGGTEVRYGAASPVGDAGLGWQEAAPRTFRIAPAANATGALVSEPFTYTLYARIPNPASSTSAFLLHLDAIDAVWTATPSADYEHLTDGTLYGVVTRAEAEARPLKLGIGCIAICTNFAACSGAGVTTLAGMLDCTSTPLDADVDGDGTPDGYKLAISFASERIDFAAAGQ